MFPGYRSHRNELGFDAIKDYQDGRRLKDFIDNKVDDVIVVIEKKFKISFKDKLCHAIVVIERKFGIVLVTITIFVASFLGPIESESLSPTISFSSKIDSPLEIVINDEAKILSDDLKINQIFKSHSPIMDYILDLKGGGLEKDDDVEKTDKLIKSIVSKSPQSSSSEISINKVLKRMVKFVDPLISNSEFWKIVKVASEPLEPEFSVSAESTPRTVLSSQDKKTKSSSFFVEGFPVTHQNAARNLSPVRQRVELKMTSRSIERSYSHIQDLPVGQGTQKVTAWSVVKHIHHAPDFGLNPKKYGMTKADLDNIANIGLINHINQGGTRPSEKFVQDFQMVWKVFSEDKNVTQSENQTVMDRNCSVSKNLKTGHFVAFDSETGKSLTGYRLREQQSRIHDETNTIGRNYNSTNSTNYNSTNSTKL